MLRPDVVQLLLGHGADISLLNGDNLTPMALAKSIEAKVKHNFFWFTFFNLNIVI